MPDLLVSQNVSKVTKIEILLPNPEIPLRSYIKAPILKGSVSIIAF